ncbi:AraC family transcriptional regulator [Gordonia aichiensis]|uniref:AraC family transcriptional regulator n=1 Tax=Gordonia aichiensis TaxID=36820 RepID=UPI003263A5AA
MKPLARYASLANYADLTRSLGGDPVSLMRDVGLDPAGIAVQDRWVPAGQICELLELTAAAVECDDFGLRLAEQRRLSNLGPLSLVLREEPDVRSALDMLIRHQRMYNEAVDTRVQIVDGVATVRVAIKLERLTADRQSVDLATGVVFGFLRSLIGSTWTPIAVSSAHPAPADLTAAVRLFGGTARYDRDFDGVVLHEADLERPNIAADAQLRSYARSLISVSSPTERSAVERTRELIEMLLPTGRCSADQVARSLGVDRRTVHRHLAAEGSSFSREVDQVRTELARHLVAGRRYQIAEVGRMLGFETAGNFSRWFRSRFGASPREFRKRNS